MANVSTKIATILGYIALLGFIILLFMEAK